MNYYEWAARSGRAEKASVTYYDVVDIPGVLVTEPPIAGQTFSGYDRQGHESANDRHGWRCPCHKCREDRGEEWL